MVKVSVVIPIYNVEDYLEECLDSIVNQTLDDIEIICVNDGSKDNSLNILLSYAKKDSRITVINQENGGHAVATNVGMNYAKGKYLFLMDSDDKLKLDALEKTYKVAEEKKVDFVLFQAINYDDANDRFYEAENYSMNEVANFVGDSIFSFKDLGDLALKIAVTPWTKLYNREFIVNSGIKFPEGLIFEDNIFFWEVLISANSIYFLKEHLFYRRWYENSSTMAGDIRFTDSIAINTMIIDVFEKYGVLSDLFKVRLYNRKISLSFLRFTQIKPEFKDKFFDELQKNFINWVYTEEFYQYLQTILIPRNKFLLDSILTSNNSEELDLLVKNYDLSSYINSSDKISDKELNNLKNDINSLTEKNNHLKKVIVNLKNVDNDLLSSNSLKIGKILKNSNIGDE
ncbi:glycosyltransferase family 2 protein [uncultured Methanobrevibacter sp.]|uniref:glycosyltransferase family 2 protein n=1 Tax=uncultured Methanobrevibacter sp. TaxID=253161 RepID=UPI0026362C6C